MRAFNYYISAAVCSSISVVFGIRVQPCVQVICLGIREKLCVLMFDLLKHKRTAVCAGILFVKA